MHTAPSNIICFFLMPDTPLLFLHGLRDRTVPIRYGRALFALAPEPKNFIEFADAGHNDLYDHGAAARVIAYLENRGLNPKMLTINDILIYTIWRGDVDKRHGFSI